MDKSCIGKYRECRHPEFCQNQFECKHVTKKVCEEQLELDVRRLIDNYPVEDILIKIGEYLRLIR